jgi:putative tryptophan/tyrosine transport system substrate-binding protein
VRRRTFIGVVGGAVAWPLAARAQQGRIRPLIGWLGGSTIQAASRNHGAFIQGLREYGYEEGKTIDVVYRWADGNLSRLPSLAKELVAAKPRLIVSATPANSIALMQTTADIPIVGAITIDPVKLGHAVSHNRPGRNFTGILMVVDGLRGKQAELLLQLLPRATTLGVLLNPNDKIHAAGFAELATSLGAASIKAVKVSAAKPDELPAAFESLKNQNADGVVVFGDSMFFTEAVQIVALAASMKMPTMHSFREHVERGGLMSYAVSIPQNYRRAAYFVDRILKGALPGDLPIELPTKLELVINLKAAKALGIDVPPKLLFTADEVIE